MQDQGRDEGRSARIKEAAKRLFVDHGYDGTTMQAIADASKVNKALLHYYFDSKDKLFLLIFREELSELSESMATLWQEGGKPIGPRLEDWIDAQSAFLARAPGLPLFIITEMTRNPDLIKELLAEFLPPANLIPTSGEDAGPGTRPGLPALVELTCAVYSLIFFPAVATPMIQHLLGVDPLLRDELLASQARLAKELVRGRLSALA